MKSGKDVRRMIGMLSVRTKELGLHKVVDPRHTRGKRWRLDSILKAVLMGLMAGCQNLQELENLTEVLPMSARRQLGLKGRLPDTTARDTLCRVPWQSLAEVLERLVTRAHRRKAFGKKSLALGTVSMDGKVTAATTWQEPHCQKHKRDNGVPFGLIRTVTSCLVSSAAKPCIAVEPIPADSNEMGHFRTAFAKLCASHGGLFQLVTYDAGANGEDNAQAVVDAGKDYLFRMNDERRQMQVLAQELLDLQPVLFTKTQTVNNHTSVIRSIRLQRTYNQVLPPRRKSVMWDHTLTLLRIDTKTMSNGEVISEQTRYYSSSLDAATMSVEQWLETVVGHWAVETTHQILDTAFTEDTHPWIHGDANGMLVMLILRRIAYTLLTLFRSVTQRSDRQRALPWKLLLAWVQRALLCCHDATLLGLRARPLTDTPN